MEPSTDKIYEQALNDKRKTDDISFSLIGKVPLVSGIGLLTLVFGNSSIPDRLAGPAAVLLGLLSLFAAAITLALFRWELRNIQICKWMLCRAEQLERIAFQKSNDVPKPTDKFWRPPPPPGGIGKCLAEAGIYSATILTWLAIPPLFAAFSSDTIDLGLNRCIWALYAVLSAALAVPTATSVFAALRIEKETCDGTPTPA